MAIQVIAATLIFASLLLLQFLRPKYNSDEPRPISYSIPIIGNAISWTQDRRKFFAKADAESRRQPFSILIAGRKHYVFNQPSDVQTIWRKPKAFSIRPFVDMIWKRLFGSSNRDVDRLHTVESEQHLLYDKYLLRPEHYEPVVIRYLNDLRLRFQELSDEIDASKDGVLVKDALHLVLDTMAKSSVVAYFGHKPVELHPNLTHDMTDFNTHGFWPYLAGVPQYLVRSAYNASKRVKACLLDGFADLIGDNDTLDPKDASAFALNLAKLHKSVLDRNATGTHLFSFMFGFTSNSTPSTYCALLRILSIPDLKRKIHAEVAASNLVTAQDSDITRIIPNSLPLLRSCYWEAVRMHVVASSIREVMETTTISLKETPTSGPQTYTLQKGGVVNIPSVMLHYNPNVNPDPDTFIPERFVSKEQGGLGQNQATSTRGFGGGTNYCPGRVFAERQIVGFLAMLFLNFEVELEGEWGLPVTAEFDDVAKTKPRAFLRLRKREAESNHSGSLL